MFIWKIYLYFSAGNGQRREPALCQLYRHTFVPCMRLRRFWAVIGLSAVAIRDAAKISVQNRDFLMSTCSIHSRTATIKQRRRALIQHLRENAISAFLCSQALQQAVQIKTKSDDRGRRISQNLSTKYVQYFAPPLGYWRYITKQSTVCFPMSVFTMQTETKIFFSWRRKAVGDRSN